MIINSQQSQKIIDNIWGTFRESHFNKFMLGEEDSGWECKSMGSISYNALIVA